MTKSIYTFGAIRLAPHFIVPESLVDGNLDGSDCYQNLKLYVSSSILNTFIHHFKALSKFQIKNICNILGLMSECSSLNITVGCNI